MKPGLFLLYMELILFFCSCCGSYFFSNRQILLDFEQKELQFEKSNFLFEGDSLSIQLTAKVYTPKNRCGKKWKRIFIEPHFHVVKNLFRDTLFLNLSDTTKIFLQDRQTINKLEGKINFGNMLSNPYASILNNKIVFSDGELKSNTILYYFEIPEKFNDTFYPVYVFTNFGNLRHSDGRLVMLNDLVGEVTDPDSK